YSSIEEFLKTIERRAFHMARMATGNADSAMDIVQDSMFKLVEKYAHKTPQEWKPLFYRILNSKTIDYYRRKAVRDKVFPWSKYVVNTDSDQATDIVDLTAGRLSETPDEMMMRSQRIDKLTDAVNALPRRQREAFMLRCWEGMSTIDTAMTMKCSEGSVKTHYSRAMHSLRDMLEDYNYD
ncbi:MAG: RNA polymerase sigma factor, partial [Porticoccaceae bacterium]|nr:RNA polymerase sigma factor [Porticoccaceae bacterium]